MEESRTNQNLLLVNWVGGKLTQDGVALGINHHLILILTEMLDRIALTRIAVKSWNHELLEKFTFQYVLGERGVGCIGGDGSESAVV